MEEARIEKIKEEYEELLTKLSNPELISNWEKFEEFSKRKSFLEKIIKKEREIKEIENKIEENKSIISAREDQELVILAETELVQLRERKKTLEKELEELMKAQSTSSHPPLSVKGREAVIVEIRAGTGGEEATLFAADLFRMYSKYADSKNWKKTVLDCHYSDLGGIKQIVFQLENGDVFSEMKYEAGVHRVQRIPKTEKAGRIHTSTSSVAILPKPTKAEIRIRPEDLKIEFYRASGPGGQYVNKRETAVRITHLPTGLVVTSQTERNQLQNKENALSILEAKLLEKKEMEEMEKLGEKRRSQIKWAKRAEKIRTYNFLQNRITDHRLKKSWYNLDEILNGNLDVIIEAFKKREVTERSEAPA